MTTGAAITTAGVANAASQVVYQSQRYGNFVYQVSNLAPGTQFTLRLHFAELYWTSAGQRRFDVAINGTTVLSNFDVFAGAGGRYKAVVREFVATADAQGNIQIKFSSRVDRAMLSGLELVART